MIRKIVLLLAILFCYNTIYAQHIEFEGVSFDGPLDVVDAELVNMGFDLVETEYDKYSGGLLFYRGMYFNMKLSVFVRYTPYSRKIYNVSVLFDQVHYDRIKEYIESKYMVKPVELHEMMKFTPAYSGFRFIYDIAGNGWIGLKRGNVNIYDNEFHYLYKAEVDYPKFVKKRDLRKWQKKYNNPLFYDNNPVLNK